MFETNLYGKDEQNELRDEVGKLSKQVKEMIIDEVFNTLGVLLQEIERCESPIEQMMALALRETMKPFEFVSDNYFIINSQEEIELEGKLIRVDFLIAALIDGRTYHIVIECDGHDYHERTKEQAIKDRSRDRLFQRHGYTVMRFTGSEIYKNPFECAREVATMLNSLITK